MAFLSPNHLRNLLIHIFCLQVVLVSSVPAEPSTSLLQFKREFTFNRTVFSTRPNGCSNDRPKLESWKEGSNCCSWDGVYCDPEKDRVIGLDLNCSGLQGTIYSHSTLFRYFPHLQSLSLAYNDIRLEEHGFHLLAQNFTELRQLNLNTVNISSVIPGSLLNRTSLTHLRLYFCGLHGEFPGEIFENLVNLQVLDVGSNYALTGKLPETVGKMKYLKKLFVDDCRFDGSIPLSLGNLTRLTDFWAFYNDFTGHLPSNITGLQNLRFFWISFNYIQGTIPPWIFSLPSLEYLYIQHNNLKGHIGEFRSKSLTYVDMSYNDLHGTVPSSSFRLPNLTVVHLVSNNLSGTLHPETFCYSTKLEILDLSYNNLSGPIPECLGNFSESLVVLHLPQNNFSGGIPDTFAAGNILKTINLSGNRLEGPLPRSISNCKELEMLDIGRNNIRDTFPNWLGQLPKLHILSLRSNKLHGSVTDSVGTGMFSQLHILDMSDNELTGPVPPNYFATFKAMIMSPEANSTSQYLWYVRADGNYFYYSSVFVTIKGKETEFARVLAIERYIDFSQNYLEGNTPESIGALKSLRGLNLSHNRFAGNIPVSLGNLAGLEWLDLSSNKLVGEIPQELTKLDSLQVIDLSWNQLSGHVPRGTHFDTFSNESYRGNSALCGFPLSKTCSEFKPSDPISQQEDDFDDSPSLFDWKDVMMGYACGLFLGLGTGCLMFSLGKPQWLVMVIESELRAIKRRFSNHDG